MSLLELNDMVIYQGAYGADLKFSDLGHNLVKTGTEHTFMCNGCGRIFYFFRGDCDILEAAVAGTDPEHFPFGGNAKKYTPCKECTIEDIIL